MRTICLDFDGVIHRYSKGWQDGTIYDPPVEGTREALEKWAEDGWHLVVCTCRGPLEGVWDWLSKHGLIVHSVTHVKPFANYYVDDRAVRFTSWEQALCDIEALEQEET